MQLLYKDYLYLNFAIIVQFLTIGNVDEIWKFYYIKYFFDLLTSYL